MERLARDERATVERAKAPPNGGAFEGTRPSALRQSVCRNREATALARA